MDISKKIVSFNIPNGAFYGGGDICLDGNLSLYGCTEFTFNGVTYKVSDYDGAVEFFIRFLHNNGIHTLQVWVYGASPNDYMGTITNPPILQVTDYTDSPNGNNFITNKCYYPLESKVINTNYDSYITDYGLSTQATINASNVTVINNPVLTWDSTYYSVEPYAPPTAYNGRFLLVPGNDIKIRANDGYILEESNISIISNGLDITSQAVISEDGKELTLNVFSGIRAKYYNGQYSPDYYYYSSLDIQINIAPTYIPPLIISNNLSNVSNDNPDTTILHGARYQANLTASNGYYISNVIITMDNIDITLTSYNNGVIDIPSVTGDLVINAIGTLNPTIINNLIHCTSNNSAVTIEYGARYQATITADSGYSLEGARVLITMGGTELFNIYNNGVIDIPSVTGNLVIYVEANSIKTFNFKSMDGLTTFATVNAVKITSIRFNIVGNTRTLIVNGNTVGTWTELIPINNELYGLALTSNATRWIIPVNMTIYVDYDVSMDFYEVILEEHEQPDTFTLALYKNSADAHKVDKTNNLEYVTSLEGVLREACSIITPEITLEYDLVDFNYVYVSIYNRYYYVTDVVYLKKGLVKITLRVDVLMSFRNEIYNQKALISRNEFTYNDLLEDNERYVMSEPIIEVQQLIDSPGSPFEKLYGENYAKFILNVIGGN